MGGWRGPLKHALRLSNVKTLYSRATVNRFTIAYFWLALFSALSLSALQGMLLADNTQAVSILRGVVASAGLPSHLTLVQGQRLTVCDAVPWRADSECAVVTNMTRGPTYKQAQCLESLAFPTRPTVPSPVIQRRQSQAARPNLACLYGLSWLEYTLADSVREDMAILFFHVWMFTIAVLTILNESIPHLGTCFVGHLLGGGWVASRIISTRRMARLYRESIVPGLCDGVDHLQSWWEIRLWHTVSVVVISGVVIFTLGYLTWKLLKLYSEASFSSLGASSKIHGMYKLALTFSVGLQLTFFFSLASACMWIEKISHHNGKLLSYHGKLYLAAFIIILLLEIPYLVSGLQSIRKESKKLFAIFFVICLIIVTFSSLMFGSLMYRFIFTSWQLFATVTVTAFVFLVLTGGLGLGCRLNFGKGLSQYLTASEALEGMNFTPVYFPRRSDDYEKASISEKKYDSLDSNTRSLCLPGTALARNDVLRISIYSDRGCPPVYLSTSRPLVSDLEPPGKHIRRMSRKIARAQRRSRFDDWRRSYISTSEESLGEPQSPTRQYRESDIGASIGLPVKAFLARLAEAPTLEAGAPLSRSRSEAPRRGTPNSVPFPTRALTTWSPKPRNATSLHVSSQPCPF